MFAQVRWSQLLASALALSVATSTLADDVFVKEGVVVKPLSKRKQRKLEKKVLKRPGNELVIEGKPTAVPGPTVVEGTKARRSLRPLFGDRLNRRSDVVVAPPIITTPGVATTLPGVIVSAPRSNAGLGDPLVMPGSVEVGPTPRVVRPPVTSTPRGTNEPLEFEDEPDPATDRNIPGRILPPPADEIPPPVVSTPRKAASSPMPMPVASPDLGPLPPVTPAPASQRIPGPASEVPSVDPGPPPATPPVAPEPSLELPPVPRPA